MVSAVSLSSTINRGGLGQLGCIGAAGVNWEISSTGVDRNTRGELGHRTEMSLKAGETFLLCIPIHPACPNSPRMMVRSLVF